MAAVLHPAKPLALALRPWCGDSAAAAVHTSSVPVAAPVVTPAKPIQEPKPVEEPKPVAATLVTETKPEPTMTKKIYVVYYSTYGHVKTMAEKIKAGAESVEGVEVKLWQIAETLPEEVLGKMHAPPKDASVPVIAAANLPEADGIIFGFPTRFGMMAAQAKALFDSTGQLWQSGALVGKPVSFFTSTATQGGGQETTIMTALTQAVHHGMIYVPIGYSAFPLMASNDEARGGSPWGAGTLAGGDGSRQPSATELAVAEHQGKHFASIVARMK